MTDSTGRDWGTKVLFWCPGCNGYHAPRIRMPKEPTEWELEELRTNKHGLWTFNGDMEKPTFSPSILIFAEDPAKRCHSFVTNGMIQFLGDCGHKLKGQTVPLPDLDEEKKDI